MLKERLFKYTVSKQTNLHHTMAYLSSWIFTANWPKHSGYKYVAQDWSTLNNAWEHIRAGFASLNVCFPHFSLPQSVLAESFLPISNSIDSILHGASWICLCNCLNNSFSTFLQCFPYFLFFPCKCTLPDYSHYIVSLHMLIKM